MARKNEYGKYIIAAGEVASYVVCPEAWRLAQIKSKRLVPSHAMRQGNDLHKDWDQQLQKVRSYSLRIKIGIWLLVIAFSLIVIKYFILIPMGLL